MNDERITSREVDWMCFFHSLVGGLWLPSTLCAVFVGFEGLQTVHGLHDLKTEAKQSTGIGVCCGVVISYSSRNQARDSGCFIVLSSGL